MKVLHLSTRNWGGAAVIPRMVHEKCLGNGYTSAWIVHCHKEDGQMHVKALVGNPWLEKYLKIIRSRISPALHTDTKYYFFNRNERQFHASALHILDTCGFTPDLICIYWISGFINTTTIKSLWKRTRAKIRIFITDMGFYTGGCHYSMDCKGYQNNCRICPAILSKQPQRAYNNLVTKQKNLKGLPIEFIASRGQSLEMANKATLLKPFDIIPNVFKVNSKTSPVSKMAARKRIELQKDKKILLIGSINLHESRKNFPILLQALETIARNGSIDQSKLEIVVIGAEGDDLFDKIPFPTRYLGYQSFEKELPLVFTASDCFISSSIADTGPYMINLSIYYNCPVIAFPVGIAKYLVGEKKAGIIANTITSECLSEAILNFLNLSELDRIELLRQCKDVAKNELQWNQEVFKHLLQV